MPVFVKPAHLGSSVGIVKVSAARGAARGARARVRPRRARDRRGDGRRRWRSSAACSGLLPAERERAASRPFVSPPGEIVYAGEWYDYEAKYTPGGMELKVPAAHLRRRPPSASGRSRASAFRETGCEGLARVDFFVDGERVLLNELNTMPGFTPTSVYARLLDASGVPYAELVERLCLLALRRHGSQRAPTATEPPGYLKSVSSEIVAIWEPGGSAVIQTR